MSIRNKMLDFCKLIISGEQERQKRFNDLFEFMSWGIQNIPEEIRTALGYSSNIILTSKYEEAFVELSLKDYNWWKSYIYNNPQILIKDIKEIEKEFMNKILNLTTSTYFNEKEKLEEVIAKINDIYDKV